MGSKGDQTKQFICMEAYKLFAEKGYKEVTMKDICDRTGLSRGGLYRHYEGTGQIFLEIVSELMKSQGNEFAEKIAENIPAAQILDDVLTRYVQEMMDYQNSLSVAIYEFFSDPEMSKNENSILKQYILSKKMWMELIEYGVKTKEFHNVDAESVCDLIIFSYQGVRMYSKIMDINSEIPRGIVNQIKKILLTDREEE